MRLRRAWWCTSGAPSRRWSARTACPSRGRQRSDLPGFVYVGIPTGLLTATVRMETPVLYFYADRETVASVRVDFPGGQITEWYPAAQWAPWRSGGTRVGIRPETASPLRRE